MNRGFRKVYQISHYSLSFQRIIVKYTEVKKNVREIVTMSNLLVSKAIVWNTKRDSLFFLQRWSVSK